jgi:S1-C subfamily serine protease
VNARLNHQSILIFSMLVLFTLTACGLFGATASGASTIEAPAASILATPTESPSNADVPPVTITRPETSSGLEASGIDLQNRLIEVYQNANPSVVYIVTTSGGGSGFIFSQEGHIVTNHHVVSSSSSFEVVYANGDRARGSLVGSDPDSDLAVLQVDELPEGVQPLPLARFEDLMVGQLVIAIGNPFGEQGSMSLGIVSGLGRSLTSQRDIGMGSTYSLPQVIQTDAPINPGNSGGPLLNLNGEVVGINSAIATFTGANSGVGFAIPVAAVERIVPSLIDKGKYEYPYIGATFASELSLEAVDVYGLPQFQGAYVLGIGAGSPAESAGLRPADPNTGRGGDLIVEIDGQPIRNFSDLNSYLVFQASVGQTIEITALRGDERVTIPLTLGERP